MTKRKLDLKCNISIRSKQICAYAHDIVIIARTKEALDETCNKLKEEAEKPGLVININKTKYANTKK
jgi:type IV secretory pathway VirB4 component